jgi:hypothetical protein
MSTKMKKAAKPAKASESEKRDPRLPPAGSTIKRTYHGKELKVLVREDGFRFEGAEYRSLSAVARQIVKCSVNGYFWFGLTERPAPAPKKPARKRTSPAVPATKEPAAEPATA